MVWELPWRELLFLNGNKEIPLINRKIYFTIRESLQGAFCLRAERSTTVNKIKKRKLLFSISVIVFCILLGCRKKETLMLTDLTPVLEEETSEQTAAEEELSEQAMQPAVEETPGPAEEKLVVHICGAVNKPGVYELPKGSRICHAVEAAGGFSEEAEQDFLNQAQSLEDGIRIYIPTTEEAQAALQQEEQDFITGASGENLGNATDTGLVNINTASEAELCTLSGIGSGKAQSIIAYRTKNGSFQKIEDIMNVEGIKDGLFQKIRDSITV